MLNIVPTDQLLLPQPSHSFLLPILEKKKKAQHSAKEQFFYIAHSVNGK